eukprot:5593610-Pyramimonas_sp.AAC.1
MERFVDSARHTKPAPERKGRTDRSTNAAEEWLSEGSMFSLGPVRGWFGQVKTPKGLSTDFGTRIEVYAQYVKGVLHGLRNDHQLPTTVMFKIPRSQAPCVATLGLVPRTYPYWARLRSHGVLRGR